MIDVPPNSLRDSKVGHRVKPWKKKGVKACSLVRSIFGVGGCVGALG
jgi:hypothetical protein